MAGILDKQRVGNCQLLKRLYFKMDYVRLMYVVEYIL